MLYMLRVLTLLVASQLFFCIDAVFAEDNWKRVYLATYPRSGNHWMRNLIEEATHIATSSVYCDQEPIHLETPFPWGGYAAENGVEGNCRYPNPGEIVVIKTHYPAKVQREFDLQPSHQTIRMVRHPVDVFYSHYMHQGRVLPEDGKIPSLFVEISIRKWIRFEKYWNQQPNVLTIKYESFYNEPYANFKLIMKTIGYQLHKSDLERALAKFPPRGGLLKHLNDYHPEDLDFMQRELGPYLKKYGYKIIPTST